MIFIKTINNLNPESVNNYIQREIDLRADLIKDINQFLIIEDANELELFDPPLLEVMNDQQSYMCDRIRKDTVIYDTEENGLQSIAFKDMDFTMLLEILAQLEAGEYDIWERSSNDIIAQ